MSRLLPYLIMIAMIFLLFVSWNNIRNYYGEINAEYNSHMERAKTLEEKRIYIDAVTEYESALKIRPDYEIACKVVDLYEALGQNGNYIKACENAISIAPDQKEMYMKLIDNYMESNQYSNVLKIAAKAEENIGLDNDILQNVIQVKGMYSTAKHSEEYVKPLYYPDNGNEGYYIAEHDGLLGLAKSGGSAVTKFDYEDIGLLHDNLIPVKKDGEYYYINGDGYRKLVPDRPADYFGTFSDGYAPAEFEGVWGYVDKRLKEYHIEYSYAGEFSNGIAPVQKDGKWAVINTDFEQVTEFIFDEIVMNEYDYCATYGVFFAKKDGIYALYDKEGKELAGGFEDVELFASDEPAAVKQGGKWGFVSKTGEMVIQPQYDDAHSFCIGYGCFKDGEKWGCIDKSQNILIEPVFDDMKAFTKNGCADVVQDGVENYIIVTIYE